MAKREAQARSFALGEEIPATLTSAAEDHAQALREELLKSTELAAQNIVGQTRAEGERRIEVAGRRAQAIAEAVSAIERAEEALGERAEAFADASKALRAELEWFAAALLQGEERLRTNTATDEPDLRLVESPATEARRPEAPAAGLGVLTSEPDPVEDADVDAEAEAESPADELDEESEDEDESHSDEDDEPPTPDQIRQFFREAEESEIERAARRERLAAESQRGWFRRFFSSPPERPAREEAPVAEEPPAAEEAPGGEVVRSRGRDRLYTDIGGAIIGLGGAAALLNFVLLK